MFGKRWIVGPLEAERQLLAQRVASELNISSLTAALLVRRGCAGPAEAEQFLRPRLDRLLDPAGLRGMQQAVGRIARAIADKETVWIYGDYDVDGSAATALLLNFFRELGVPARHYIPHRVKEGYGLHVSALQAIRREGGTLVVTVDTGISGTEAARAARELGLDLIITDHHEPPEQMPEAFAVINPRQPGCGYPEKGLTGVGLAFKLAWAVAQELAGGGGKVQPKLRDFLVEALGLVALGTIADVAPLTGENRILVSFGLEVLAKGRNPGIGELKKVGKVGDRKIGAFEVGFILAPRVNAGGRIDAPDLGARLLSSSDLREVEELALKLDQLNLERQRQEREIFEQAMEQAASLSEYRTVVLADDRWHVGVVGIVASKLVERMNRPVFLIGWNEDGLGKGSGRSIDGFHMVDALKECHDLLIGYGGHAYAAGLSLRRERFDSFRERFEQTARGRLAPEDLAPRLKVEETVDLGSLTPAVARELERIGPFGPGNPEPMLVAPGARVAGRPRLMGGKGQHLSFFVSQNGSGLRAVAFGKGEQLDRLEPMRQGCDVAFNARRNVWQGEETVELHVKGLRQGALAKAASETS
jgi:single-stranded-DNA-specific exonuclease